MFINQREEVRNYMEKEVNEIIRSSIAFDDIATIRREMINMKIINRDAYGREYFKSTISQQ